MDNAKLEKIEKQLELLMLKVDIILHKLTYGEQIQKQRLGSKTEDELFDEAKAIVIKVGEASASILQRKLKVGYARAARLLDMLEEDGVVGPSRGAKSRKILAKE